MHCYNGFECHTKIEHVPSRISIVVSDRSIGRCHKKTMMMLRNMLFSIENGHVEKAREFTYDLPDDIHHPHVLDHFRDVPMKE